VHTEGDVTKTDVGPSVERCDFPGTTYRIKAGPRAAEPEPVCGLTAAELDALSDLSAGAALVCRTGPRSYTIVR